jgi:DNA primase
MKTVETNESVIEFLETINDENIKKDTKELMSIISKITNKTPKLWGSIIGFDNYKYTRKGSKKEYEWFNVGLAPRKDKISLYLTCYLDKEPLVKKLGDIKHGKGCIYIKNLQDLDLEILKTLIKKYKNESWYN